jgi:putative transposase
MPEYRRFYVPGGTYFFTVVTCERRPFLTTDLARRCLRDALTAEREKRHFEILAFVLLPDHMHAVWTLPRGDTEYSTRWAKIKECFTRQYLELGGTEGNPSSSRVKHRERAIWQRRFWEHTCGDEDDLERCIDYVHWNPVKHGYVQRVRDYEFSSFHRFVKQGHYDIGWGGSDPDPKGQIAKYE